MKMSGSHIANAQVDDTLLGKRSSTDCLPAGLAGMNPPIDKSDKKGLHYYDASPK